MQSLKQKLFVREIPSAHRLTFQFSLMCQDEVFLLPTPCRSATLMKHPLWKACWRECDFFLMLEFLFPGKNASAILIFTILWHALQRSVSKTCNNTQWWPCAMKATYARNSRRYWVLLPAVQTSFLKTVSHIEGNVILSVEYSNIKLQYQVETALPLCQASRMLWISHWEPLYFKRTKACWCMSYNIFFLHDAHKYNELASVKVNCM